MCEGQDGRSQAGSPGLEGKTQAVPQPGVGAGTHPLQTGGLSAWGRASAITPQGPGPLLQCRVTHHLSSQVPWRSILSFSCNHTMSCFLPLLNTILFILSLVYSTKNKTKQNRTKKPRELSQWNFPSQCLFLRNPV